jgi:hypothetical protein
MPGKAGGIRPRSVESATLHALRLAAHTLELGCVRGGLGVGKAWPQQPTCFLDHALPQLLGCTAHLLHAMGFNLLKGLLPLQQQGAANLVVGPCTWRAHEKGQRQHMWTDLLAIMHDVANG